MSLFSKRNNGESRGAAQAEQNGLRPAEMPGDSRAPRRHSVGQLLRETRERQGAEISRIATALRIRAAHLTALEEGQYDRLPGAVYALGFVRTYAVHLGLDGEEAVRRFKLEAEGFDGQRDLAFPLPLAERSIPGGVMLLTALLFAICAYGVWYYLSSAALPRLERVAPVPAALLPRATPPEAAHDNAAPAPAATTDAPGAGPSSPAAAPPTPGATSAPPASPPLTDAAPEMSAPPAPKPAPPQPTADARTPAASAAPPATPPHLAAAEAPPVATAASEPPSPSATALPEVPPAPTPQPPAAPHDYGLSNGDARVVLHATADSWIQVRDAAQTPIFTRELHAGDSYRVPDVPGVNMRTGKASALSITVDGHAVPPVRGDVRLNVLLDPDHLRAGTAAQ